MDEMNCPFCDMKRDRLAENDLCFAIYDAFPVSTGHALVIPKKHVQKYFDLSLAEQTACWEMLNAIQHEIQQRHHPDGFNVGINVGEVAGQTVNHVHIHLIPRYVGDVENPRGGVRGVIPLKKEY